MKPENKASPSSLSLMPFHKVQIYAIAMTFQIKNLYGVTKQDSNYDARI